MKVFPSLVLGLVLLQVTSAGLYADPYGDAVMRDKPFAYYRLDEGGAAATVPNGSSLKPQIFLHNRSAKHDDTPAILDQMKAHHGAFMNGPAVGLPGAIRSSPTNKGMSFSSATSQHVRLTKLGNFGKAMCSGFSVEYWLKLPDATQHQTVLGTANDGGYVTDFLVDIAYNNAPGRLRLYYRDDKFQRYEADFFPGEKNINLYDDRWHHVVHVYHPKAAAIEDRMLLHVDGIRQTMTVTLRDKNPSTSSFKNPMTLGAMNLRGKMQDFLQGSLDEVAFYNTSLSESQVQAHFQAATSVSK